MEKEKLVSLVTGVQKGDETAAGEETGRGTDDQNGDRLHRKGKAGLHQRIAHAGDQKAAAGGDHGGDLTPEGGEEEHKQQRGRRHQTEHIVRQVQILNQGGGYGMDEVAGENIQGHCEKEQRKAIFIAHNDVLTFGRFLLKEAQSAAV